MKRGVPTFSIFGLRFSILNRQWAIGNRQLRLAAVIIAFGLIVPAYCQTQTKDIVLLLEQTPVKGGEISPVAGVHHFKPGSEVMLKAVPKPGYKFVHWLGEVSDATASSTVVYLNKPKVIIAVFEQAENGISADGKGLPIGGGGGAGGGLFPTALDFSRPGGFGGGVGQKAKPQKLFYSMKGKKPTPKAPEVPEPATGLLMMLGGLFALKRRSSKRVAG
ncbi:PEP-CTERM sorting domain-containing protein [Planctomycetota bacterium]